jgi:hypothetical protein
MMGLHHRDIVVVENVSRDIISSHPTALAHLKLAIKTLTYMED